MELARLFATVGFKVDDAGLKQFRVELQTIKNEVRESAIVVGNFKNQLTGLNAVLGKFKNNLDPKHMNSWRTAMLTATQRFFFLQEENTQNMIRADKWATQFVTSINRLHAAITGRVPEIQNYANAIRDLAMAMSGLRDASRNIDRFRQVPASATTRLRNPSYGSGGGGGGSGTDRQYIGYWGRAEGMATSPFAAFMRPMLPTGMGLFNAVAGGYAFKELVRTGREMMALELKMKAVSDDSKQFADNMAFVKNISQEMGLDVKQVGDSFANIFVAAKDKMGAKDLQGMFRGFSKYYTAVHMTSEDQRLANLAIQQMFGKDKIQAQEARLQMGQRVTPFMKILTKVASENIKGFTTLDDVMKKGLLDPKLLVGVSKELEKIAETGGAYEEALHNSQVAQIRFNNSLKWASKEIMQGGLDKALRMLFVDLSELVKIISPFVKGLVKMLVAVANTAKVLWDMKGAVSALALALAATIFVRTPLLFALIGARVVFTTAAMWQLYAATLRTMGLFGALVYVGQSVADFMDGANNWVYTWELMLQVMGLSLYNWMLDIQLSWRQFWQEWQQSPVDAIKGVFSDRIKKEKETFFGILNAPTKAWENAGKWVEGLGTGWYQERPRSASSLSGSVAPGSVVNMTVNIDASKAPPQVMQDPAKFWEHAVKKALEPSGLPIGGTAMPW